MRLPSLRLSALLAAGIVFSMLAVLVLVLFLTELGLSVWERLAMASPWFWAIYLLLLFGLVTIAGWACWRLLRPRLGKKRTQGAKTRDETEPPANEDELLAEIERRKAAGVAVDEVLRELDELRRRRLEGDITVAFFGEISSGKSSLIQALLPGVTLQTSPVGGTTRQAERYAWQSEAGDRLILVDLPGLNEADGELDALAMDEAQRAHLVIYVCDSDLDRDQYAAFIRLRELQRPMIVALNKIDRYDDDELTQLHTRLRERIGDQITLVTVQSGGIETIEKVWPDGRREQVERTRPARVDALSHALQHHIDANPEALDRLRDASVFVLAQRKLDASVARHRNERCDQIVRSYTGKAVLGAMAAVGPGTDLLIQGYLGMHMLRELCAVHEVPASEVDLQRFLSLVGEHVRRTFNLLLALAGNVFKAFPGVGTVVGGMLHAVAYGLIFESLGKAVARSLDTRGELSPGPTLRMFENDLSDDLESRTRRLARLVLEQRHGGPRDDH